MAYRRRFLEEGRDQNRFRIFSVLASRHRVSRPELAEETGLSRATIAVLVDELFDRGLAHPVGLGSSSGGRPPTLVEFNPNAAFALGASMQDYQWTVVCTNLDGDIVDRETSAMPDQSPEAAVDAISTCVGKLRQRACGDRLLPSIGVGTPGLVDMHSGVIVSAADMGWSNVAFETLVEEQIALPAIIANRSKVAALAEYWYASTTGVQDLIYVTVGTGVAAGIIHRGELYLGTNSSAGELGHITVLPDGPACACGNRGCLQQLVSEDAIAQRARMALRASNDGALMEAVGNHPEQLVASQVLSAADAGDPTALTVVSEAADFLAIGVANLINLFNPQVVYLGGPVIEQSPNMYDRVAEQIQQRAMAYPLSALSVRKSTFGSEAGAVGASVLVLKQASSFLFSASQKHGGTAATAGK
ncbi:MAG: ROK family protein [Spirochaetes bacterium]|nr:ROK family protein [Spirochaetota bacterium]